MCGTPNKMESVFCLSCGARLVPLTVAPAEEKPPPVAPPIKGLSLPARESPGELPAEWQKIEPEPTDQKKDDATWLDQLRNTPPEENEPVEAEDVPTWLKSVEPTSDAKAPVQEELPPSTEIPEWLQAIRPAELPAEEPAAEMVDDSQIPDWLRTATEEKEPPVAQETAALVKEPVSETPIETESAQPVAQEPAVTPTTEEEMPAWLSELKPAQEQTAEPVPAEDTSSAEPLLESLEAKTSAKPHADEVEQPAWARPQPSTSSAESDEDIPDWLRTLPSSNEIGAEPSELLLGAEAVPELQPALPEEVPDWLASLKPATQLVEDDSLEITGPLEGLRGVLPLALAVTEPHPPAKTAPAPAKNDGGQLFESILAAPRIETETPAVTIKRRTWSMRPFVYLLIALAALVPFFLPSDWIGASLPISNTPASKFYDAILALPVNSTVLVSFDYDASQSGEMDLQANAILHHLIQRRTKIITISTLETGAPIANRVLGNVTQNLNGYAYGTNYVNLGYLPGHEAGLAQLATNGFAPNLRDFAGSPFSNLTGFTGVKTLRDVAMIVELAGSEDTLKQWMEQVQPKVPTKIVAGVSASVEPKARAYYDTPSKQLTEMVSGVYGAAQYEILSNQPGVALSSINAQGIVQLTLIVVIVLGNIAFFISRGRKQNA